MGGERKGGEEKGLKGLPLKEVQRERTGGVIGMGGEKEGRGQWGSCSKVLRKIDAPDQSQLARGVI